jgi:DNA-binding transcriptional LysR family regulator
MAKTIRTSREVPDPEQPALASETPAFSVAVSRLRVRHLQLLDALDRLGSLRQVGRELGVTQATAVSLIDALEYAFESTLVTRDHTGTRLSPTGRLVLRRTRVAIQEVAQAVAMAARSRTSGGAIRLGASPYLIAALLPEVVRRMRERLPTVEIDIQEGTISALLQALQRGMVDAVLGSIDSAAMLSTGEELEATFLFAEDLCVVAGRGHPLFDAPGATLDELLQGPWVLPQAASHIRGLLDAAMLAHGVAPPMPRVECRGLMQILELASATAMLTVAPRAEVVKPEWSGRAVPLQTDFRLQGPPYAFVARRYARPIPEVSALRRCSVEATRCLFGEQRLVGSG